ncbi:hypothetical protein SORBI_3008G061500 [Sorghum bicolor]|uniref:Leucine-rich repeat-containing N-terminal plant-type domain-containing protein n=2 Tax=Sorghum bicolor TaxID=4558 RepID=A0A1B6PBJ6_SORBI|nr:hypothetical protein SORBI_3008G061500 [Sorghum bicolor]
MKPTVVDRNALLSFKSSVQGNLSDWASHMWTWTGVACNSRRRVISLDLAGFNLTGFISPAISNLSALEYFDLSDNQLSGNIPPELGKLSQLWFLSLHNNLLTGVIPETLGLLKSMTDISLSSNNLIGEIPDICNCSSLIIILRDNNLTGEIPFSTRCQLPYLDVLFLFDNRLVGVIPSVINIEFYKP